MMALIFTWISLAFASQDCPALDGAVEFEGEAGKRRIALVVGVGDYLAEVENERGEMVNIDLKGPPNDAVRMRTVLVERYGFPAANVCMLVDSDATRANFLAAWDRHLMRAEENDIAVFFFAGHGSQVVDTTGRADETDGMDETLMFHDSRAGSDELVDDDFNALLHGLNGRTRNGTILIDACNSGSATRGVGVRQVDPITEARLAPRPQLAAAAGGEHDYSPETLPGFVIVTGAEGRHRGVGARGPRRVHECVAAGARRSGRRFVGADLADHSPMDRHPAELPARHFRGCARAQDLRQHGVCARRLVAGDRSRRRRGAVPRPGHARVVGRRGGADLARRRVQIPGPCAHRQDRHAVRARHVHRLAPQGGASRLLRGVGIAGRGRHHDSGAL